MLKLTPEAIEFILLQRTQLKKGATVEEIEIDFRKDFAIYQNFLPDFEHHDKVSVVDIGSGIGIQNILLSNYYGGDIDILMIDKTKTEDNIWYGFEQCGAFYNSLDAAQDCLMDNGVNCMVQEATNPAMIKAPNESVDLVTSIISLGFHYPIETYLKEVIRVMKPGATLILDVRKNTEGMKLLLERFPKKCNVIKEYEKYFRVICVKKEA